MKKFSIFNAIKCKLQNLELDTESAELNRLGEDEFKKSSVLQFTKLGGICVPSNFRSTILSGEIAGKDVNLAVNPLENKLIAVQAGATFLTGLKADISFPNPATIIIESAEETGAASDGGRAMGSIDFTPRLRLTAYVDVSKQLILQADPGTEDWLFNQIIEATAAKLESYIFGVAAATASTIQGMGYAVTTGTLSKKAAVRPTFAEMINMEAAVNYANAHRGNLAFITSGLGSIILKKTERNEGTGFPSLLEDGKMIGFPLFASNSVSNIAGTGGDGSLLLFGDWSALGICQFGGYSITPDHFSLAMGAKLRLNISSFFDVRGLHGTEATDTLGATDPNDYAKAFTALPIKLS